MPVERLTPEKRRELTRAHLLAAAAEVFAERGFQRATLDQIADAAGFSKGAVYSNFASKDELFLALNQRQGEEMVNAYAEATADAEDQTPAENPSAANEKRARTSSGLLTTTMSLPS